MAYITAAQTRAIKKDLSLTFPDYKFRVRKEHCTSVRVSILSGPKRFDITPETYSRRQFYNDEIAEAAKGPRDHVNINHFYPEQFQNGDLLKSMLEIINYGNHDNSDIQTDYFDVGWYVSMEAGTWETPYICTEDTK